MQEIVLAVYFTLLNVRSVSHYDWAQIMR